jgi:Tol biopolymer transport system component
VRPTPHVHQLRWTYEWQRETLTRLTFGGGSSVAPIWSPDGRYIVFQTSGGMFWARADGSGKPRALTQSKNVQYPSSFTADGKWLAFFEANPGTGFDLWTVPVESDSTGLRAGKPQVFLQTPFDERYPSFSPDGRWLAYASNESESRLLQMATALWRFISNTDCRLMPDREILNTPANTQ